MEILLLGIYSFFVWLIFFKLKLLPWNIISQVIVVTLPIIGIAALILCLNVYAPSSHDVRVLNYHVQVIPQVSGRVIEVPVEGNRPVKKGDVLFKIDPVPFQETVRRLEGKVTEAQARVIDAISKEKEMMEQQKIAKSRIESVQAGLDLANRRVEQYAQLVAKGAGRLFDVEDAETNKITLESDLDSARARDATLTQQLAARTESGELAQIAAAKGSLVTAQAELDNARWELSQTTVHASANGTVINLQLRPGQYVNNMPFRPALVLVEDSQVLMALYHQNEIHKVAAGNEAEVALATHPGRIIKCKVDSIVWAQGTGQIPWTSSTTAVPETGYKPATEGRFAVRLETDGRDKDTFLAAGAQGQGAIYTEHGQMIHIVRKVILRVGTKMEWLILKLH